MNARLTFPMLKTSAVLAIVLEAVAGAGDVMRLADPFAPTVGKSAALAMPRWARASRTRASACLRSRLPTRARSISSDNVGSLNTVHHRANRFVSAAAFDRPPLIALVQFAGPAVCGAL